MELILISIYSVCMLFVLFFSLGQLHLAWVYRKSEKCRNHAQHQHISGNVPMITIQLPVYNERYVIDRLLDAVANLEWPPNRMEVQVLDDSDDETSDIIKKKLLEAKFSGLQVSHIQRSRREGYKAGALHEGLKTATGELIAIFDADFVPHKSFLTDTIAEFNDPDVGMVQTRWDHLNKNYSLLTRLQAFGLNGHFTVEQTARSRSGSFINFNGTAGVWRKKCIEDSGGWQHDTLTEDLDLSYRAQMKGWKFKYLNDVHSPAELPVIISAVKSQQFRWTKGGAETARKNLGKVMKAGLNPVNKAHAFFHLTNNLNFLMLFIASVVSIPLMFYKNTFGSLTILYQIGTVFILGFLAISYFYWQANRQDGNFTHYLKYFPLFIIFSLGFILNNSLAVIEGWLGINTPFVRTPKFNIIGAGANLKENAYFTHKISAVTLVEGLLSLYFFAGIAAGFVIGDYGLMLFHLMLALGFGAIFYYSIRQA